MNVYLEGRKVNLSPSKSIGKGGEADVYDIGNSRALKIFKSPGHIDYAHSKDEQSGAEERIKTHQKKLRMFPTGLPARVITPDRLATNKTGNKILGYDMPLLSDTEPLIRYSDKSFRNMNVGNDEVINVFMDLHQTVCGIHDKQVVIGDFNDLNVLVINGKAYIIDTDSFQFDKFLCRMFTAKFLDPKLADPKTKGYMIGKPHNAESDWYSFAVMLWQCLLLLDPFGGIYKPKDKTKRVPQNSRAKNRISVFNNEVKYPKSAIHYNVLPDDLLHYFQANFELDKRGEFPVDLLQDLRFCKCDTCGTEHARSNCPNCKTFVAPAIKEVIEVTGKVTATRVFWDNGLVVFAKCENGELKWICHDQGKFSRENDGRILEGELDYRVRYRLLGDKTLMAKNNQLVVVGQDGFTRRVLGTFRNLPMFDANSQNYFWVQNGQLLRNGKFGSEYIGDVLANQTLFWVGEKFGFGFYIAGNLNVAFVFDASRKGLNDNVQLPPLRGQLIDSTCFFGEDVCWFFVAMAERGKVFHYAIVVNRKGNMIAQAKEEKGASQWLQNIRGKCVAGNFLLSATDDGIVRIDIENGGLRVAKKFPDTEKYVDENCHLFPGKTGLYVVKAKEIYNLKIN